MSIAVTDEVQSFPVDTTNDGEANATLWVGTDGNDVIDGGNGEDIIFGLDGDDTLIGGNSEDVLIGGPGDDTLTGGRGNDTFVFNFGDARTTTGEGGQGFTPTSFADWLGGKFGTEEEPFDFDGWVPTQSEFSKLYEAYLLEQAEGYLQAKFPEMFAEGVPAFTVDINIGGQDLPAFTAANPGVDPAFDDMLAGLTEMVFGGQLPLDVITGGRFGDNIKERYFSDFTGVVVGGDFVSDGDDIITDFTGPQTGNNKLVFQGIAEPEDLDGFRALFDVDVVGTDTVITALFDDWSVTLQGSVLTDEQVFGRIEWYEDPKYTLDAYADSIII